MKIYYGRTCYGWYMYGFGDKESTWFIGFSRVIKDQNERNN